MKSRLLVLALAAGQLAAQRTVTTDRNGSVRINGSYYGDGSHLTGLPGGGDMASSAYVVSAAGAPSNPCSTAGSWHRNTAASPVAWYGCPTGGGSWVGPFVIGPDLNISDRVQYISASGSDSADGKSWRNAKAHLASAVSALPTTASGVTSHYGTVMIAPGTYVETSTPIEFNSNLRFVCAAVSGDGGIDATAGCVVQLGNGRNTALLAPTSAYVAANGYAHFLQLEGVTLDGNAANNTTAPALVQVFNGGFQNVFTHVNFQNAKDFALKISRQAVSFSCVHCTWGGSSGNGGAIYLDDTAGGNAITLIDSQIDNSGPYPIDVHSSSTGGSNVFSIDGLKSEATTGSTGHNCVLRYTPPSSGGHPFAFAIRAMTAVNTIGSGTYAVCEQNASGYAANWSIIGSQAAGYTGFFTSAKTGHTSHYEVKHLVSSDTTLTSDRSGDMELSGGAILLAGNGTPEAAVTAKVGSTYLRLDGGTGTTLYVKQAGTGNTGWAAPSGGDASTNTSSSADSQVTLFSGVGGKTLKPATGTGIPKLTSGVLGTATAGSDYEVGTGLVVPATNNGAGIQSAIDALPSTGGEVILRANTTYALGATGVTIAAGQSDVTLTFRPGSQITYSGTGAAISVGGYSATTYNFRMMGEPNILLLSGSGSSSGGLLLTQMSGYYLEHPVIRTQSLGGSYSGSNRYAIKSDGGDVNGKFTAYGIIMSPRIAGDFKYGYWQTHAASQMDGNNRNQILGGYINCTFSDATYNGNNTGTVAVTKGLNTVTGSGVTFTSAMTGRNFIVIGNPNDVYTFTFVDSTHGTLNRNYAGATGSSTFRLFVTGPVGMNLEVGDTTKIFGTDFDSWPVAVQVAWHGNQIFGAFEGNNGSDFKILSTGDGTQISGAYSENWQNAGSNTMYNGRVNFANLAGTVKVSGDDAETVPASLQFSASPTAFADAELTRVGPGSLRFGSAANPTSTVFQNTFGAPAVGTFFAGDSTSRWLVTSGGVMVFGDGTAVDANLYRSAANVIKTDGSVVVVGTTTTKLPTSCSGLAAGTLWNNAGTPAICP